MNNGKFIISLDFELMWGVRDKMTPNDYGENIIGVQRVIPELLEMFNRKKIKATFSVVGFLFFKSKEELLQNIPKNQPEYNNKKLSPYDGYLDVLENIQDDRLHFAPNLIKKIQEYPEQEIGTHTFSHYYCLEPGQTIEAFKTDLEFAIAIAKKNGLKTNSLIFPRNQFNKEYLKICSDLGIICYRGNENSYLYKAKNINQDNLFRKALRMLDTYINISGHNCYSDKFLKQSFPVNIPSSRFLRPFSKKLKFLENFRLRRIKKSMTYAAKNNLTYHLWWHPHNFGLDHNENFDFLYKILTHYETLNHKYNFESTTMTNLAKDIINGK